MVKIRLRRTGAKKQPHYRVVVADSKSPREGKFIEVIGHYDPRTDPPTMELDAERALHWLGVGAQPSAAVQRMLDKLGILEQVTAVRKGEVSIGELAAQLQPTGMKETIEPKRARPAKVEVEEELVEEEDWSGEDEEELEEEPFEEEVEWFEEEDEESEGEPLEIEDLDLDIEEADDDDDDDDDDDVDDDFDDDEDED